MGCMSATLEQAPRKRELRVVLLGVAWQEQRLISEQKRGERAEVEERERGREAGDQQ